jgi:hypothetical protein
MTEPIMASAALDLLPSQTGGGVGDVPPAQAGWGVSLTDLSSFEQSLQNAVARIEAKASTASSQAAQAVFQPFEHLNVEASRLAADTVAASKSGTGLSPGEVVHLTYRCHEFLFHTQLASNAANRTSDGIQQLFRQQS